MSRPIVVLGSLNMDFVVGVCRLPAPGETVLGRNFQMAPGGKGANQACAAGRLAGAGTEVRMIGRVGHDVFADHLKASLSAAGVDVGAVHSSRSQPTGVALIEVDSNGQNSIVVASGANHDFLPASVEGVRAYLRGAAYALFQLETPIATVARGLQVARDEGARTMLDPAPAQALDGDLLAKVDILTPNESEAHILLGRQPDRIEPRDAPEIARLLRAMGVATVVLKLGEYGSYWDDGSTQVHAPAFEVNALDTTAAGDIFNAALVVALVEEKPVEEALRFANAAAAISVTRRGAQASVPSRPEVDALAARHLTRAGV